MGGPPPFLLYPTPSIAGSGPEATLGPMTYGRDTALKGAAARLETALTGLGIEHSVKEIRSAGHAFLNDAGAPAG